MSAINWLAWLRGLVYQWYEILRRAFACLITQGLGIGRDVRCVRAGVSPRVVRMRPASRVWWRQAAAMLSWPLSLPDGTLRPLPAEPADES